MPLVFEHGIGNYMVTSLTTFSNTFGIYIGNNAASVGFHITTVNNPEVVNHTLLKPACFLNKYEAMIPLANEAHTTAAPFLGILPPMYKLTTPPLFLVKIK